MNESEHVDPSQLRSGPIRQESLSAELLERIREAALCVDLHLDKRRRRGSPRYSAGNWSKADGLLR